MRHFTFLLPALLLGMSAVASSKPREPATPPPSQEQQAPRQHTPKRPDKPGRNPEPRLKRHPVPPGEKSETAPK